MKKIITLIILGCVYGYAIKAQTKISADEAYKHIGETVTICDKIYGIELIDHFKTKTTINVGSASPRQKVSLLLSYQVMQKLTENGKMSILNKNVCVTGKVIEHKGQPEIVVAGSDEIFLHKDTGGAIEIKPNDFMRFE